MASTMKNDVLLFTSTNCPHCAALKESFQKLQQQDQLGELSIVNIEEHPEQAAKYGIRSVPWFKIAELVFIGAHSLKELTYWVNNASTPGGIRQYVIEQLETGKLQQTEQLLKQHPDWLAICVSVLADMQSPLQARIGISAIFESLAGMPVLETTVAPLEELLDSGDARIRGDACHLLSLVDHSQAKKLVRQCLQDPDPQVREIAQEAIADSPC
jgi:thioredoxin-like negative regulator of GroEL